MSVKQRGKTIAGATRYHPDLFDFKWADHILNDAQWLMADTFSWQYGSMYQAAYANLSAAIAGKTLQSETVAGVTVQFYLADDTHKICPASEEDKILSIYNKTGNAWYYIIDTVNQRFKLPRAKHNKYANSLGVVGNGMTLGLTDGTNNAGLTSFNVQYGQYDGVNKNAYGTNVGTTGMSSSAQLALNTTQGITTDPTKSGMIAQQEQDTDQYKYLYFYVGAFTQTSLENIASIATETLNNKVDKGHQLIDYQEPTSANGYTWYRKYADGWVEQGGTLQTTTNSLTFPIEMADTNYQWFATAVPQDFGNFRKLAAVRATTGLTGMANLYGTSSAHASAAAWDAGTFWQVSGMAA